MTNNDIVILCILYLITIPIAARSYFKWLDLYGEETTLRQRLTLLAASALWPVAILASIALLISSGVYWIATGKSLLK